MSSLKMFPCSVLELAPLHPTPSHINITRSITPVARSELKWPGWAGWRKQKQSLFFAKCCLSGPFQARTLTGATPCPWQHAGLLMAFQWLHNLLFPPLSQVSPALIAHHGHLCWRAYHLPPRQTPFPVEMGSLLVFSDFLIWPHRNEFGRNPSRFCIWLFFILSFWYCREVCYIYRIRFILVRCERRGIQASVLSMLSCLQG